MGRILASAMTPEDNNNVELLARLQAGDQDAFRELVLSHQRHVINICYRFVDTAEEAEDLAQETFIEIHRSLRKFRGASDLTTWIHRIAVSKSLDYRRRQTRKKRGGTLLRVIGWDDEAIGVPAPQEDRPDHQLEQQERRRVLRQALDKLPEGQRVAFLLSKYDGLKHSEIAAILQTSVSAVESLIHRARKNLQKRLEGYYGRVS